MPLRRLGILAMLLLNAALPAAAAGRPLYDVRLFTRIGNPGQPEGIARTAAGTVLVGTNQKGHGDARAPSRVFAFDGAAHPLRDYTIAGQDLAADHGINGFAIEHPGELELVDLLPPRLLTIDLATGRQQTRVSFPDLPQCGSPAQEPCTPTADNRPASPNAIALGAGGTTFVSDLDQATVWLVVPGASTPVRWLSDARFAGMIGPNGIAVTDGGRTLLLAVTAPDEGLSAGAIYRIDIRPDGSPGTPALLWRSRPADAPDGIIVGASGRIYVALAGADELLVLDHAGHELERVVGSLSQQVPFDSPASLAFAGDDLLVTNQSAVLGDPASWAVLDVYVADRAAPAMSDPRPCRSRPSLSGPTTLRTPSGGLVVDGGVRTAAGCSVRTVRAVLRLGRRGSECRFLSRGRALLRRPCASPPYAAASGTARWHWRSAGRAPAGRHVLLVAIGDADGRTTFRRVALRLPAG